MSSNSLQRIKTGVLFFVLTIVIATCGYRIANWPLLDAFYMVVLTVFGVGYQEVYPITTPGLKMFTIGVIVAGTSSAVYIVTGLVQLMAEGEIERTLGARKMTQGIETLKDHVIICGYGRLGQILAKELHRAGVSFVLVDNEADRKEEAEAEGLLVLVGNAVEEETLQAAGVARAKVVASVLTNDADNVFLTLTARNLNPDLTIIARGEIPSTEAKLRQAGADEVVLPAAIGGFTVANIILRARGIRREGSATDELAGVGMKLWRLNVPQDVAPAVLTLAEIETREGNHFSTVAVRHASGEATRNPAPDYRPEEGDTLIVIGREQDLPDPNEPEHA